VRLEVSNAGVVPRRLVVELFVGCIVLVKIEVELFMADVMNETLFCSRQRKSLRRDHWWIDDVVTFFSLAAGTKATLRPLILMG
jgi:hypothetical protein